VGLDDTNAAFKARVLADEIKAVLCGELGGNFGFSVSSRVVPLKNTSDIPDVGSKDAFTSWVDRKLEEGDAVPSPHSSQGPATDLGSGSPLEFDPIAAIGTEFVPLWNVKRKAIAGYTLNMTRVDKDGRVTRRSRIYPVSGKGSLTRDMDRIALIAGGEAVGGFNELAHSANIIIPLHFDTVSTSAHRNQFMEAIRSLPEAARSFLTIELCATPPGTPESRILEVLGVFKTFCRLIMMRVPFDPRAIAMVPQGPVVAVSTIIDADTVDEALLTRLSQFIDRAKRHQLNAVLNQQSNAAIATAAVQCGFTHVGGDVIGPPVANAAGIQRFIPPFMKALLKGP
jgi:hypothetical protein